MELIPYTDKPGCALEALKRLTGAKGPWAARHPESSPLGVWGCLCQRRLTLGSN